MSLNRVVITGLGALTPLGNTVEEYWEGLVEGKSGADYITRFDTEEFKTKFACEVKDFEVTEHLDRKAIKRQDSSSHYAMVTAEQAVKDAGIDGDSIDQDRVGVIWASGIGGIQTFHEEMHKYFKLGKPKFNPFFIPKMIADIAAGHISIKYGFRGPNFITVSACASSTHALIDAYNYIRLGQADAIVTGGSEAAITEAGVGGFSSMRALSQRNDDPKTASRPFDKERDGFVLGEGSGSLVLESYEHAKERGAEIYGEVIGGGMSADAYHLTAPHPDGVGARNVMKNALNDAEVNPEAIDYINVHGTSTPLGDIIDALAIHKVTDG
jgi:3-oxoacyl-[acyl-carrier-protein] synthase II